MTRRELFRKRIAPILFGVAIALMARKSCQSNGLTHATYILDYGAAEPNVAAVDLDVWMNQDVPSAHFHRVALGAHIGVSKFDGSFPSTDGLMKFDIALRDGTHKMFDRRVHADENATVTINLEPDLK